METALNPQLRRTRTRGADLLLLHCATIGNCVEEPRLPARDRLDAAVGAEFAELLVGALTPGLQNVRRSSSP